GFRLAKVVSRPPEGRVPELAQAALRHPSRIQLALRLGGLLDVLRLQLDVTGSVARPRRLPLRRDELPRLGHDGGLGVPPLIQGRVLLVVDREQPLLVLVLRFFDAGQLVGLERVISFRGQPTRVRHGAPGVDRVQFMVDRVLLLGLDLGHARLPGALRVAEVLGHGDGWRPLGSVAAVPWDGRESTGAERVRTRIEATGQRNWQG
ncbi:unnamed protein product, partial [Pelagomonas calceolata]